LWAQLGGPFTREGTTWRQKPGNVAKGRLHTQIGTVGGNHTTLVKLPASPVGEIPGPFHRGYIIITARGIKRAEISPRGTSPGREAHSGIFTRAGDPPLTKKGGA